MEFKHDPTMVDQFTVTFLIWPDKVAEGQKREPVSTRLTLQARTLGSDVQNTPQKYFENKK